MDLKAFLVQYQHFKTGFRLVFFSISKLIMFQVPCRYFFYKYLHTCTFYDNMDSGHFYKPQGETKCRIQNK